MSEFPSLKEEVEFTRKCMQKKKMDNLSYFIFSYFR